MWPVAVDFTVGTGSATGRGEDWTRMRFRGIWDVSRSFGGLGNECGAVE